MKAEKLQKWGGGARQGHAKAGGDGGARGGEYEGPAAVAAMTDAPKNAKGLGETESAGMEKPMELENWRSHSRGNGRRRRRPGKFSVIFLFVIFSLLPMEHGGSSNECR